MNDPVISTGALNLIGASAGSGKTYRLTQVVTAAVNPRLPQAIDLEGLVAVTYTHKGAAELTSRIRRSFAENGAYDSAHRLPLAHIGTVHAVCLRLVTEFAIDAGLSPLVDVAPGSESRLLRQALEWGLKPDFRAQIEALAQKLELRLDNKTSRIDWLAPVHDIMTLARSNRIHGDRLPEMAVRSADRLLELLGPAERDGNALDHQLLEVLRVTAAELSKVDDGVKKTDDARTVVQGALKSAERHRLKWSDWLRLQHASPGKSAVHIVAPLQALAARVDGHPRLHAELRELTVAMYEAARQGLEAYDAWKKRRRVIDFVDMLDRALTLVEHPDVRAELRDRFKLLVVDEFQDTSPIQLALFVRLHEIAQRSTWVGDRKQCIFEYAGADPELMQAVTDWGLSSGGAVEQLPHNWRSRPELVEFFNQLFSAALAAHGYAASEVVTTAKREPRPEFEKLPPLGFWLLDAKNQADEAEATAEGVRRLLAEPGATLVEDRSTREFRELEPGDVAVLVATNAEAERLAEALAQRGVRAAIARADLLATPEGTLVKAALRRALDPRDSLAAAEIAALTGFDGVGAEDWLNASLAAQAKRRSAIDAGETPEPAPATGYAARVEPLRAEIDALAPTEAVDHVLGMLDLATLCRRWPDPDQRLNNLDAIRALAVEYEEHCSRHQEAATIAGLLRYFDEAAEKVLVRDEELASDDQHVSTGPQSVTIVTYHRAKGLEWPVVVLGSLDRTARRDAFEVSPESERSAFDPTDPLGGRWIRYWPWPYGSQQKSRVAEAAAASPEGLAIAEREHRERARLLYVGFTRARDHLILAVRTTNKGLKKQWLDELADAAGTPLLELPSTVDANQESAITLRDSSGKTQRVPVRPWLLSSTVATPTPSTDSHAWFSSHPSTEARLPYWIAPSRAAIEWPGLSLPVAAEAVSIGPRLPLGSSANVNWDIVGNAVHAFLAADLPDLNPTERLARATRLLEASALLGLLAPQALIQAGDHLRKWIASRWPNATWHREVPITAVLQTPAGARRVAGTIDLLLETPEGVILIDHKSYPGGREYWGTRAAEFAPQFAAYAEALRMAGKHVLEIWVSFAIGGGVVRLG